VETEDRLRLRVCLRLPVRGGDEATSWWHSQGFPWSIDMTEELGTIASICESILNNGADGERLRHLF
jgi:hypothetical protein